MALAYEILKDLLGCLLHWKKHREKEARERPKKELLERFRRIFAAQGLQPMQGMRVVPALKRMKAADLLDDDRLLQCLDDEVLASLADTFGVQRCWLEMADDENVYESLYVDERPSKFLELLIDLRSRGAHAELHVVKGTENRLDSLGGSEPLAVFLREEIARPDEGEAVWRDIPIMDRWDWGHLPCRIQLKALALMAWQFEVSVYSHVAPQQRIDAFLDGKDLCGELIRDTGIHSWHLDDYIFTCRESVRAKDESEALAARRYLEEQGLMAPLLEAVGRTTLRTPRPHWGDDRISEEESEA